ncbi:hypothetical protein AtubIFM55763_010002 [Aspergillus tubingensis]|uniref:2-keto-4-pentenoate hydratase/2-oxohepta-3-ene-1,7-dioic acid hydratase n=1 Tax=Aspergillus niger TaxID=5061 RepID=A0A100IU64_ASPNG|nr:fumarylacetoacetate hydrolase [Aspergillus tubingensis]GAQ47402.1 2-keto-4-pentenoate hydratase/2-oxohepta-3-ene-1,7-dioic acid hydratase [Aspergillus niger]GFN11414.1 fumarylacetoacetate hydrolase [Aspergillus tubingensis]GLA77811.1 hypothetical protein AtubIFM55763_010002 [Aspergillus tubingensis]
MTSNVNYAAYLDPSTENPRIGHLDLETATITPLSFRSGAPLANLYQVIEAGVPHIAPFPDEEPLPLSRVKLLPPLSGRDVLAVGKNYAEHAREFNASGYDASDKVDQPTHPVIFTKRATSIIASGDPIWPHPSFTSTVDYEGEIGVIIGKNGFQVSESTAMDYVWGYTIINDMTARERQRDHKQFFLGKSPDTFCPMGPIAVPADALPAKLTLQTYVNGEKRQEASLSELIFSIPRLIASISSAQTIQVGDVLATGTPAGVGFGFRPMKFLQPGDEVAVSVTGLGTLTNRIADPSVGHPYRTPVDSATHVHIPTANQKAPANVGLTLLNSKPLFYQRVGNLDGDSVLFIHGLGASSAYFYPLVARLQATHCLHLLDLEGHGLSPTSALNDLTVQSFSNDVYSIIREFGLLEAKITVVAHSLGALIALALVQDHPDISLEQLILMGPPPHPLPSTAVQATLARAGLVRARGMAAVVDAIVAGGTSRNTQKEKPEAIAAIRMSLLGQDSVGYAKACVALARSGERPLFDPKNIKCPVRLITGAEDAVSSLATCQEIYIARLTDVQLTLLENVGHWHLLENPQMCVAAVSNLLNIDG